MAKIVKVNKAALLNGIAQWWTHPTWNKDFHNGMYKNLLEKRNEGFTMGYWSILVDELCRWRANRPMEKDVLYDKGIRRLRDLEYEYEKIKKIYSTSNPSFEILQWGDLSSMFEVVREIKGNLSPVFPSKLCHFILPGAYLVIDNVFIGMEEHYSSYWKRCQKA